MSSTLPFNQDVKFPLHDQITQLRVYTWKTDSGQRQHCVDSQRAGGHKGHTVLCVHSTVHVYRHIAMCMCVTAWTLGVCRRMLVSPELSQWQWEVTWSRVMSALRQRLALSSPSIIHTPGYTHSLPPSLTCYPSLSFPHLWPNSEKFRVVDIFVAFSLCMHECEIAYRYVSLSIYVFVLISLETNHTFEVNEVLCLLL